MKRYPKSRITGLSNSATQKIYIDEQAKKRGLTNIKVRRPGFDSIGGFSNWSPVKC